MSGFLCWHRAGRKHGNYYICANCGVAIEECPCNELRSPKGNCPYCSGSGFVAIVRGQIEKFKEYIEAH